MRSILCLFVVVQLASAQEMTEVIYEQQSQPARLTEAGPDLVRFDREDLVVIVRYPDIWVSESGKGFHTRDPERLYRSLYSTGVPGLELGKELEFVRGLGPPDEATVNGVACDMWSHQGVQLMVDKTTKLPFMLVVSGRPAFYYGSFKTRLPYEARRFEPPTGVSWEERPDIGSDLFYWSTPSSSAGHSHFPVPLIYAPWEGEVVRRYGEHSLAAANEHLYEDLPPDKAVEAPVPANPMFAALAPARAQALAREALEQGAPSRPQWSIIAGLTEPMPVESLIRIATTDPSPTDRAYALTRLPKSALEPGLFDGLDSVRYLTLELMGGPADGMLDLPLKPRNPFHHLFLQHAAERMKIKLGDPVPSASRAAYLELARRNAHRPVAAAALYVLGDEAEGEAALKVMVETLLTQGTKPQVYHSVDFWLSSDFIAALTRRPERVGKLRSMLRRQLDHYQPSSDILLITLGYALGSLKDTSVEPELVAYQSLNTDNLDVYCAAATSLGQLRCKSAFPALLHLIQFNKQPFSHVAQEVLEEITGVPTPGKPEDTGVLANLGLGRTFQDPEEVYRFWNDWWTSNQNRLVLDPETRRFVVR